MDQAIAKLIVEGSASKPKSFVTAWIFSDNGYVLTAGHCFYDLKASIGQDFLLLFPNDEQYMARLIEFEFSISNAQDYAILLIVNQDKFKRYPFIKIGHYNKELDGKDFELLGYRESFYQTEITSINGRFLRAIESQQHQWLQLEIRGSKSLKGMSGSAIIAKKNNLAVAIQSSQNNSDDKSDILVSMISKIPSSYIRIALNGGYLFKSSVQSNIPSLNFGSLENFGKQTRYSLLINDHTDAEQELIYKGHTGELQKKKFNNELEKALNGLGAQLLEVLPAIEWRLIRETRSEMRGSLSLGINSIRTTHDNIENQVRIICDTSDSYIYSDDPDFTILKGNNSHIIGINISKASSNNISISSNSNFDIIFEIGYVQPKFAINSIMNVVKDISLDISIFHSNKFATLQNKSITDKRLFSLQKARFASENIGLYLYGQAFPSVNYVSFAFFARTISDSDFFDERKYITIWEEFYLEHKNQVLNTTLDTIEAKTESQLDNIWTGGEGALSIEELAIRIKSIKKVGSQISKKKLLKKLESLKKDKLYVLCILVRKPRSRLFENMIQATFGKGYKLFMFDFLPGEIAKGIQGCIHLFKLYLIKIK